MGLFGQDPDEIERYGFKFKWTSLHRTPEELEPLRHQYDTVGTKALERIDEIAPLPSEAFAVRKDIQSSYEPKDKRHQRDFFKLVKAHAEDHEDIKRLWTEVHTVPDWVDWDQIERGQKVFWRYGGASVTALAFLSLLGGLASGKPVQTLDRTGGFGAKIVRRRLLETTQHTLAVHKNLESIKPGGEGWESSVRVRLLHGSIRRRMMQLAKDHEGYYDMSENGVPINNLDSIGTATTFCATLVWIGYPRQGIHLREAETKDFLALWRYVTYLLGVPHDWLATPAQAKAMMESPIIAEYAPTRAGSILANNIITGFEGTPPTYASRGFLNAITWWLNGKEVAKVLEIEKPSLWHTSLVASQCWLFMLSAYINRSIPILDRWNINRVRSMFYEALIEKKEKGALGYKAMFTFKWIPDAVNTTTPLGEQVKEQRDSSGPLANGGLERAAILNLLVCFGIAGYMGYGSWNVAKRHVPLDQLSKLRQVPLDQLSKLYLTYRR